MNLVIDASVFVAALNLEEPHYQISQQFFKELGDQTVILPWLTVLEIGNRLLKQSKLVEHFGSFQGFLDYFNQYEVITIDYQFAIRCLPLFERLGLKTADATVAVTAFVNNAVLVSWDRQLLQAAAKLVTSRTPAQFIKK